MRTCTIIALVCSVGCASAPPPERSAPRPAADRATQKESGDYSGPVWFDSTGQSVVRKSATGTASVAGHFPGQELPPPDATRDPATQAIVYQRPDHTVAWIVTGVGAALAVTGAAFVGTYFSAANRRDDLIEEQPDRFDARPVRRADDQAYAFSIAAAGTFSAAAVAFGAAVYLFLTTTGEAPPDYDFGAVTLRPNGLRVDF